MRAKLLNAVFLLLQLGLSPAHAALSEQERDAWLGKFLNIEYEKLQGWSMLVATDD
jgi:hypothetical protein